MTTTTRPICLELAQAIEHCRAMDIIEERRPSLDDPAPAPEHPWTYEQDELVEWEEGPRPYAGYVAVRCWHRSFGAFYILDVPTSSRFHMQPEQALRRVDTGRDPRP